MVRGRMGWRMGWCTTPFIGPRRGEALGEGRLARWTLSVTGSTQNGEGEETTGLRFDGEDEDGRAPARFN
jgi:hypothetical protein